MGILIIIALKFQIDMERFDIHSNRKFDRAEARRTTILQPVPQKPHPHKDRQDEKAESYLPDEGTR